MMFGITRPCTVAGLFGKWYKKCGKDSILLAWEAAFCWFLRLTRNDCDFDKCRPEIFLQVLFRGMFWFWFWVGCSEVKKKRIHIKGLSDFEDTSSLVFFSSYGWPIMSTIAN